MATDRVALDESEPVGMKRNVMLLSGCVALSGTGASIVMVVTALAGKGLAQDPVNATLPLALQFTFTAIGAVPAATATDTHSSSSGCRSTRRSRTRAPG